MYLLHRCMSYRVQTDSGSFTIDLTNYQDVSLDVVGPDQYILRRGDRHVRVVVEQRDGDRVVLRVDGHRIEADVQDARRQMISQMSGGAQSGAKSRELKAPMPGLVRAVRVQAGDEVGAGDGLLVLEAMKMENEIKAQHPGRVAHVKVKPGDAVAKGAVLIEFS